MGLDDKPITDYLEKAAGMAGCHVVALKALSSSVESAEDIFKEGNAAEELRQMDDNTMKFLNAQKVLDQKLSDHHHATELLQTSGPRQCAQLCSESGPTLDGRRLPHSQPFAGWRAGRLRSSDTIAGNPFEERSAVTAPVS